MNLSFHKADNGSIIIGEHLGNYMLGRAIIAGVSFDRAMEIRTRFQLSDIKTAEMLKRLNKIEHGQILRRIKLGSDEALANWIRDKSAIKSIKAIAKVADKERFEELYDYCGTTLDELNSTRLNLSEVTESELQYHGYDVQHLSDGGGIHLGGSKFLKNWFESAAMVMKAIELTESRLRKRNRKAHKLTHDDSAERVLYGQDLPNLYERITGKKFDGKRKDGEVVCQDCHVFVSAAAKAIGQPNASHYTVQDHFDALKSSLTKTGRGRPAKK
jgi:hypothetical protein